LITRLAKYIGFEIEWQGVDENEIGINKTTGKKIIEVNKEFYRPAEVHTLLGDCTKARKALNWVPEYTFKDLVFEMCEVEMQRLIGDKK
jgi:GDPmannose 4,6-dehydratase